MDKQEIFLTFSAFGALKSTSMIKIDNRILERVIYKENSRK